MRDISGQTFDKLTAVKPTDKRAYGSVVWEFKCECGKTVYRSLRSVEYSKRNRNIVSCGCGRSTRVTYDEMIGCKFGKLTVVDVIRVHDPKKPYITCRCVCECGAERTISPYSLNNDRRTSCSHKCRIYRPKMPSGMANANQVYKLYINYAKKANIPFNISFDDFLSLTQAPCSVCNQRPSVKWQSAEPDYSGRNGAYCHNKIAYIDRDIGYDMSNVLTVCLEHMKPYRIDHRI